MKNYKELLIWKKGIELVKAIYKLTKQFPVEEKFGTVSQITRAAVLFPLTSQREAAEIVIKIMQGFLISPWALLLSSNIFNHCKRNELD